jgi:phosphoglycolate phosphatase
MATKTEAVLFDLDGTVINSYKGIQQAFDKAFLKVYDRPNEKSIEDVIGPPIDEILIKVTGETDTQNIAAFLKHFKHQYDSEEYKISALYEEMEALMKVLHDRGIKLYIATNKRYRPTLLIVNHLSLDKYISGIYCSDINGKTFTSKSEMVMEILQKEKLSKENTILVGDTHHDEIAAKQNEITFIYAAYGFGNLENIDKTIYKPIETLNFIN